MSRAIGYAVFGTSLGECAVAWSEAAIVGVSLPEVSAAPGRAGLARRYPEAAEADPPAFVRTAIENVVRLLAGEKPDFSDVPLDLGASGLRQRIYDRVRQIPVGRTMTYGEVARDLDEPPQTARVVGSAMGANPCPIIMPCHRVLAAGGRLGGFSAPGGAATKLRLLEIEGAAPLGGLPLFGD